MVESSSLVYEHQAFGIEVRLRVEPSLCLCATSGRFCSTACAALFERDPVANQMAVHRTLAQKVAGVRDVVVAKGARLRLLPPYSLDINPIENGFSKLKALLRRVTARTIPDLRTVIAKTLPQFTSAECANYLTACGCEPE